MRPCAFAEPAIPEDLENLYRGLIRWQAFRGSKSRPEREAVHKTVVDVVPNGCRIRTMRLTDLTAADLGPVGPVLEAACTLKINDDGPSLVAASKCLHFLIPRLFVIVDRQMVGEFALRHEWIRGRVKETFDALPTELQQDILGSRLRSRKLRYLDILLWAAAVMRDNPYVTEAFAKYVTEHAKKEHVPPDIREYEAAAFEWLLLGLVHLSPEGVKV